MSDPTSSLNSQSSAPESSADASISDRLSRCEHQIGYTFRDKALLQSALTHASSTEHRLASNERLEFLGDAILGAVVCELLYELFPDSLEGELTRIKSVVVSRQTCAKIAEALGLRSFLFVGKGLVNYRTMPLSLMANVFESLIAAVYLDGGHREVRRFVEAYLSPEIEAVRAGDSDGNYKSILQQLSQREHYCTPTYVVIDERGPDHSKLFKVVAQLEQDRFHPAWGRNKKEAEQRAACNALAELNNEMPPYPSD